MESCHEDLKQARQHLRQAAAAVEERLLGKDVVSHLRQAARSALKAGIAAIDERERAGDKPSGT